MKLAKEIGGEGERNLDHPNSLHVTTSVMIKERSFWIVAHHWNAAAIAVDRGFVSLGCPPYERLQTLFHPGDHILFYILRTTELQKVRVNKKKNGQNTDALAAICAFVFPGVITSKDPYQVDMGFSSTRWRRDVLYDPQYKGMRPIPARCFRAYEFGFFPNLMMFERRLIGETCRGVMEIQKGDFEGVLGAMEKRERDLRLRKALPLLENKERDYVDGSVGELGCATAQSDGHRDMIEGDAQQGKHEDMDRLANVTRPRD